MDDAEVNNAGSGGCGDILGMNVTTVNLPVRLLRTRVAYKQYYM